MMNREIDHTRGGVRTISPLMCTWEAQARFELGDGSGALELIRRCWGTMLKKGAQTFWEFSPNHPEETWAINSHAWSTGCTWLLSAYVLGVRPETPGFETVRFAPCGEVDEFNGVVPVPAGLIAVRCRTEKGKHLYTLAVPAGTKLVTDLPKGAELFVEEYEAEVS